MSGRLQIHVPQAFYKAEDSVSGSVYLVGEDDQEQDVEDKSISITFTGRLSSIKYWSYIPKSVHLFAYMIFRHICYAMISELLASSIAVAIEV